MRKITPFLWFDNRAEDAINFYTDIFKGSRITSLKFYGEEGPGAKGAVKSAIFWLDGEEFMAIDAGPEYTFTPAISFFVYCDTEKDMDDLWDKLSNEGKVMMEMDKYPFSDKYGWVQDKFGISWQLNLMSSVQKIVPLLMYTGEQSGRAEEAMNFYVSIFADSKVAVSYKYEAGEGGTEGAVKHGRFSLGDQEFMAMDGSKESAFAFTPAISLFVSCESQEEIDTLWEKLSADGGEKGKCGWLTDKFGVSWQIVPVVLGEMLNDSDPERAQRVMEAMLSMQKIDVKGLHQAYTGKM